MSTQILGNIELVTKQEVEGMLEEVVVSEQTIDDKIAVERENRETAVAAVRAVIEQAKTSQLADKTELDDKITDEAAIRDGRDRGIEENLAKEIGERKAADQSLLETLTQMQEDNHTFKEDAYAFSFVEKIKGLPIAMITVTNTDKSLHVGDTITTIDEDYFPKRSVDFIMYSEQLDSVGASKTVMLVLRLDNDGNVKVVNMVDVATATSVTDEASAVYFTER